MMQHLSNAHKFKDFKNLVQDYAYLRAIIVDQKSQVDQVMKDKLFISSQHKTLSMDYERTKKDLTLSESNISFLNGKLEEEAPYKDLYNKLSYPFIERVGV